MRAAKVFYPQAVTPDGPLVIVRSSHDELKRRIIVSNAAVDIQRIGHEAWANSDWFQAIATKHQIDVNELANQVFNPANAEKVGAQYARVKATRDLGRQTVYWFGKALKRVPEDYDRYDMTSFMATSRPNGFAKIDQDTGSEDNKWVRRVKKAANLSIYACIHDLNVTTKHQGRGLGTALAFVGLADQPRRMKSSLYTASNNEAMRAWAEKYGYQKTDEYEDKDLLDGMSVPFIRYQAPSVGQVLEKMSQAHPWLEQGHRYSMFSLMLDEYEAEMMSINPKG